MATDKVTGRQRRHARIRRKISGTAQRPRLSVYRSLNQIYAQIIDDTNGVTIVAASSVEDTFKGIKCRGNIPTAKDVGSLIAGRAIEKGIKQIVFDRSGYLYHGRVQALADAAREAGLEF